MLRFLFFHKNLIFRLRNRLSVRKFCVCADKRCTQAYRFERLNKIDFCQKYFFENYFSLTNTIECNLGFFRKSYKSVRHCDNRTGKCTEERQELLKNDQLNRIIFCVNLNFSKNHPIRNSGFWHGKPDLVCGWHKVNHNIAKPTKLHYENFIHFRTSRTFSYKRSGI